MQKVPRHTPSHGGVWCDLSRRELNPATRTVLRGAIGGLMQALQWIVPEPAYYACEGTVGDEREGQKSRLVLWKLAIPKRMGARKEERGSLDEKIGYNELAEHEVKR